MPASKRYKEATKLIDKDKTYTIEEAIVLVKSLPLTKFDETLEISGKLGADPKQSDQLVRGSVTLPAGTGKEVTVLVFCEPEKEQEAKKAGADHIGSDELVDKILKDSWTGFDCCIATPAQMRVVSKLGRFLGPRGLMPSPKNGTVTDNVAHAVKEAKRGKIDFRMDKFGCIHVGVGKMSFDQESLIANVKAFVEALMAAKPNSLKGDYVKSLFLSTTMSPSLKIAV